MGNLFNQIKKSRKELFCRICHKCLKCCENTTKLHFHLKEHHHHSIYLSLTAQADKRREKPKANLGNQLTMVEAVSASQKLTQSSSRWNKLTDSICYFIAKDMHPLDTMDEKGFHHLLQSFEPRYNPPSRKMITTKYMPQMYKGEKAKITHHLSGIGSFSLTTRTWVKGIPMISCSCSQKLAFLILFSRV